MKTCTPDYQIEQNCTGPVCGIDEVGRGPLAGPVVAAAVILKPEALRSEIMRAVNDSKKLTSQKRQEICLGLSDIAHIGIGLADVSEIDQHNIYHATFIAMKRAYEDLCAQHNVLPATALIAGNKPPDLPCNMQAIIKGDTKSISIAAASIVAKEFRDDIMKKLADEYPAYGWDTNVGYPTRKHLEGLKIHGVTPHHRRFFKPVSELIAITS
jgi:ribonuclease HII